MILLIEPIGIEITSKGLIMKTKPLLLIEPIGIEISEAVESGLKFFNF